MDDYEINPKKTKITKIHTIDSRLHSLLIGLKTQLSDDTQQLHSQHDTTKPEYHITDQPTIRFKPLSKNEAVRTFGAIQRVRLVDKSTKDEKCAFSLDNATFFIEKCAICISEYKHNEMVRILDCNHKFHKKCLDTWLYIKFQCDEQLLCPLCQRDLEDDLNT